MENAGSAIMPADKKGHHEHHAHFLEQGPNDLESHDSKIIIDQAGDDAMNVRLGFLQYKHVYEVTFTIVDDLGEDVTFDQLENLFVKVDSVCPSENGQGHDIVLTFSAMKEKLMQESLTLTSVKNKSKKLTLSLMSRVLGKGKGTPALKTGIHCKHVELDDESDASDWQGF